MTTGDSPQPLRRAAVRRKTTTVKPKRNPGRKLFRSLIRKEAPATVEGMTDEQLLAVLLGERGAAAAMQRLEQHGGLQGFHVLADLGPHGLLSPGIDEGNAARLVVLWEVAARISEPFRGGE